MVEVEKIAHKYRMQNYGNLVMSSPPIKEKNKWIFNLKSAYPKIIIDDSDPPIRDLYFVNLNNIGKLVYNSKGQLIESTSRDILVDRIDSYLNIWENRVEKIIIKASSNNLAFSPTIQYLFNPLRRIISTILFMGNISDIELKHFPRADRASEWAKMLESLELIERVEYGYKYGNMWTMLLDRANKIKENETDEFHQLMKYKLLSFTKDIILSHLILSHTLEENYTFIKDVMNMKGINRVLNVNNLYYKPCIEADKLLSYRPKTILYNYNKFYSKVQFPLISSAIWELVSIGLFEFKNGMLTGNQQRFEKMMEYEPSNQISLPITDFV